MVARLALLATTRRDRPSSHSGPASLARGALRIGGDAGFPRSPRRLGTLHCKLGFGTDEPVVLGSWVGVGDLWPVGLGDADHSCEGAPLVVRSSARSRKPARCGVGDAVPVAAGAGRNGPHTPTRGELGAGGLCHLPSSGTTNRATCKSALRR